MPAKSKERASAKIVPLKKNEAPKGEPSPEKKSSPNTRKKTPTKPAPKLPPKHHSFMSSELAADVTSVVVIGVCILVMVGFFMTDSSGVMGNLITNLFRGLFGIGAFVLPVALIGVCIYVLFASKKQIPAYRSVPSAIIFLALITFIHILKYSENMQQLSFTEFVSTFYGDGGAYAGGLFGASIGSTLIALLGVPGAFIVLFTVTLICVMVLTGKSVFTFLYDTYLDYRERRADTIQNEAYEEYEEYDEESYDEPMPPHSMLLKPLPQREFVPERSLKRPTSKKGSKQRKPMVFEIEKTDNRQEAKKVLLIAEEINEKRFGTPYVAKPPQRVYLEPVIPHTEEDMNRGEIYVGLVPETAVVQHMMADFSDGQGAGNEEMQPARPPHQQANIPYDEPVYIPYNETAYAPSESEYEAYEEEDNDNDDVFIYPDPPAFSQPKPVNNMPMHNASMRNMPVNNAPMYNASMNSAPMGNPPMNSVPMHNASMNVAPMGNPSMNSVPMHNASTNNAPMNNAPVNNAPMHNASMNNMPMNSAPMGNAPMNNAPSNYAPAPPSTNARPSSEGGRQLTEDEFLKEYYEDEPKIIQAKKKDISYESLPEPIEKEEFVYEKPPLTLLGKNTSVQTPSSKAQILENAKKLEETLKSFGVSAKVVEICTGPTVTRYELSPGQGVKVSKISSLSDDLALNLAAAGIRIEAPIPGKSAVGIEVPNKEVQPVFVSEVIWDEEFQKFPSKLAFGLGKDIAGDVIVWDIARMPHLLIAGATGAGKSVCINTLITSILYKSTPEEVKLLMIDPKVVELSVYNGIPHLLIPVVTDPKKAAGALNWAVVEMSSRYTQFAEAGVRDLKGYNAYRKEHGDNTFLPQIVIIIDELADLMMATPKEVEEAICRLAQLARAAGIHLIIATQRPSVDVITGLIKANVPSRLAFAVSSGTDSRTILDMVGAEKLLGKGDMLFKPVGMNKPLRVQGAFISDKEVESIVTFLKKDGPVEYDAEMIERITVAAGGGLVGGEEGTDEFTDAAIEFIVKKGKASVSMLQRQFRIGYNRAARIIEELEERGIVGEEDGSKPRQVLMTKYEWQDYKNRHVD